MVYDKYKCGMSHVVVMMIMMMMYIYVCRSLSDSRTIIFMKPDRLVTSNPGSHKLLFCNVTNGADIRPHEGETIMMLCNKS